VASVEFDRVEMVYDGGTETAVDEVSLKIEDGEFFVLVGPSGCGKSTLLRLLAGLEFPTSGEIRMDGADATELSSGDRDVAMVFQNYAIYPHMSVRKNIGYGLRVRGGSKQQVAERVEEVARLLGLQELLDRRPASLSGGQLQRVAMGRAIARRPRVFLMDEPLSNLDAKLRVSMRAELERLHRQLGVTTVYVTHDQVEAMTLGQRAAVMRAGVVQQVDTPQRLYAEPANAFVAAFIGSPPMNFAVGVVEDGTLRFGGLELSLGEEFRPPMPEGERFLVGVRPEDLRDPEHSSLAAVVEADCVVHQDLGADVLLFLAVEDSPGDVETIRRVTFSEDQDTFAAAVGHARLLCARVSADHPVRSGDRARLAIDPGSLHFFDLESGRRLSRRPAPAANGAAA
jgi:multiple sugar transport system ATP-binding protein